MKKSPRAELVCPVEPVALHVQLSLLDLEENPKYCKITPHALPKFNLPHFTTEKQQWVQVDEEDYERDSWGSSGNGAPSVLDYVRGESSKWTSKHKGLRYYVSKSYLYIFLACLGLVAGPVDNAIRRYYPCYPKFCVLYIYDRF